MPDKLDPKLSFERELVALLPRFRRFAAGLAGSQSDGDDLVQSALMKALTNREQWRAGTRLDSWVYRIIQNHWIDTVRSRKARGGVGMTLEDVAGLAGTDGVEAGENALNLGRMQQAMRALPEEQRSILMLVAVEGLSYAEAAEIQGIPVGTVMSRLARARAHLSKIVYGTDSENS